MVPIEIGWTALGITAAVIPRAVQPISIRDHQLSGRPARAAIWSEVRLGSATLARRARSSTAFVWVSSVETWSSAC